MDELSKALITLQEQRKPANSGDVPPPPSVMVPARYSWLKFLAHQGWNDERVLNAQSVGHVMGSYWVYELEAQYGAL